MKALAIDNRAIEHLQLNFILVDYQNSCKHIPSYESTNSLSMLSFKCEAFDIAVHGLGLLQFINESDSSIANGIFLHSFLTYNEILPVDNFLSLGNFVFFAILLRIGSYWMLLPTTSLTCCF